MWHKIKKSALIFVVLLAICGQTFAQAKRAAAGKSPLCTQDNALEMIQQQINVAKTFDNPAARITVLVRAADLLWPYEPKKARAAFTEAFQLATENENENDETGPRSVILRLQVPDQRYVVIRAVAKRDSELAKELTQRMLNSDGPNDTRSDTRSGHLTPTQDSLSAVLTAEKLLLAAYQMAPTDINAALDLAKASLNYPASSFLTHFLYRFAEVNQQGADQFYARALTVYADTPMRQFLYLQAYPFAWRQTLNTPVVPNYAVPANFVTNPHLQRRFIEVLLRRAQQAVEGPLDESDFYRSSSVELLPGRVHLLQGLIRLEPEVRRALPDLLPAVTQAREKILVSLLPETQKLFLQPGREAAVRPEQTFEEEIESALKIADVDHRDERLANAVLSERSDKQSLTSVIDVIDKISVANIRADLLEMIYFRRARTAIQKKQIEEAARLVSKVEGHEQRAYLYTEIAKVFLNSSETLMHGRENLDRAIAEANKAGVTIFAARTLLTASSLYAKIDVNRSIALLGDAINRINRLESPDFSSDDQAQVKRVRRPDGAGHFIFRYYMPGLDPERAIRELAKIEFDTALAQSSALTDKLQRALATFALAEVCFSRR